MTSAPSQAAALAVLAGIARAQACRRCGQPLSAHWHYRDNPTASRACSRYRPPRPRRNWIPWRRS